MQGSKHKQSPGQCPVNQKTASQCPCKCDHSPLHESHSLASCHAARVQGQSCNVDTGYTGHYSSHKSSHKSRYSQEYIRPRVLSQEVTVRVVTRDHKGLCDKSNKQRSEKSQEVRTVTNHEWSKVMRGHKSSCKSHFGLCMVVISHIVTLCNAAIWQPLC